MSLKIERLRLYPIKSCAGFDVPEFQIGEAGPQISLGSKVIGDREWMFVDSDGKFLTQRTLTQMSLLHPKLSAGRFLLTVAGRDFEIPLEPASARMKVSIWGKEVDAARVDSPLNQAVSDFLGKPVQLVHFDSASDREALLKGRSLGVQTRFTDTQPYLIVTLESLRDLNSRMKDAIEADRFRPNLILSGASRAFEEDDWQFVGNDRVIFESTKACGRCKVITIDPATGVIPSSEPLVALSKYRKGETTVLFGQYFLSRSFGEALKAGARLKAQFSQSTG